MASQDSVSLFTNPTVAITFATLAVSFFIFRIYQIYTPTFPEKAPKQISQSWPILGALRFFTARNEFFFHSRSQSTTGNYSFHLAKYPVVTVTGDEGRRTFFDSRHLHPGAGYAILFGQAPSTKGIKVGGSSPSESSMAASDAGDASFDQYFAKRMKTILQKEKFANNLPQLVSDTRSLISRLASANEKIIDPFETIYQLVFRLTMRTVGCNDIANDEALCQKTCHLYEDVEKSATPAAILFPWFPSLGVIKRTVSSIRLYTILDKVFQARKKAAESGIEKKENDPLQTLMDEGDDLTSIMKFILGALMAGILNSGINACWVLVYLASHPEHLRTAREEVLSVAAKHNPSGELSVHEALARLPVEAWESSFPFIDACLRDSIRLQLVGCAMRRNISGSDVPIGSTGEIIPNGAFVTYHLDDIHMDPTVYPDPEEWSPLRYIGEEGGRFKERTEGSNGKKPFPQLMWGAGRHPCLGMRFAKLENNLILAYFIASFDFELSSKMPQPNRNAPSAHKPSTKTGIKYSVKEGVKI